MRVYVLGWVSLATVEAGAAGAVATWALALLAASVLRLACCLHTNSATTIARRNTTDASTAVRTTADVPNCELVTADVTNALDTHWLGATPASEYPV